MLSDMMAGGKWGNALLRQASVCVNVLKHWALLLERDLVKATTRVLPAFRELSPKPSQMSLFGS